eukprot:scaffold8822_cov17-Tisochrysis_lutea.AAC.2
MLVSASQDRPACLVSHKLGERQPGQACDKPVHLVSCVLGERQPGQACVLGEVGQPGGGKGVKAGGALGWVVMVGVWLPWAGLVETRGWCHTCKLCPA